MIKLFVTVFTLYLFCISNVVAGELSAPAEVRSFIASRQILDVIYFRDSSIFLSKFDKDKLRKCLEILHKNENGKKIFRLEGFSAEGSSPEQRENRALFLAKNVADYLRLRDINRGKFYITGFPANDGVKSNFNSRVELVVYENIFNFDDAYVEKYVLGEKSHLSHD